MPPAIRLLRPKQWTKNLLVFAALLFTNSFMDGHLVALAFEAFFAMSAVSSVTYIFNDLQDIERDRSHPKKAKRPLAAGEIQPPTAILIGVIVFIIGFALAIHLGTAALWILGIYLTMQVAYNFGLKRVPVSDVYTIAIGFVLRACLGAAAIDVKISGWLLFCTGALALMLGFGKRRNEFIQQGEARAVSRQSLIHYNEMALNAMVIMFATAAAICYGVYSLESETATKFPALILTAPFVFYGITRYVLLVFTMDEGGEPEDVLFRDPHLIASILLFAAAAFAAVSGMHLPLIER